jgi:hypothetical protein
VVGCNTGSRREVPGERKPVIRDETMMMMVVVVVVIITTTTTTTTMRVFNVIGVSL